MDQIGAKLLPFYIVIDVSYSMSGRKLDAANSILPEVVDALSMNPILSDKVRIGLIDFSDDARVQLPLCDVLEPTLTLPMLSVRGGTSYAAAFRLLRSEIPSNIAQLKADGFIVHRPAVFFISDGEPTDRDRDWRGAFADLVNQPSYPNVIPFAIDGADAKTMQSIVYPQQGNKRMRLYVMDDGYDAAAALKASAEILISSVLQSGHSISAGSSGILLPSSDDLPTGISSYSADDDFI